MSRFNTRIFLQDANYGRGVDVRVALLDFDGQVTAEAQPLVFNDVDPNRADQVWSEPAMRLRKEAAQNLMDELWFLGFRPERGEMSVGQVAATERHLQDMRTIAFAKLGVSKP